MVDKRIGALVIGQTPREDLVAPLTAALPNFEIQQVGALDGLSEEMLPNIQDAAYPLSTRLNNGRSVTVSQKFVEPRLQQKLDEIEQQGVVASILLCAGTFEKLQGKRPLIKPFNMGLNLLRSLKITRIGLIAPFEAQIAPIEARWQQAGFKTAVWSADMLNQDSAFHQQLNRQIQTHHLQSIVLDYVGHPLEAVKQLQNSISLPVFDLGHLAISTLASQL